MLYYNRILPYGLTTLLVTLLVTRKLRKVLNQFINKLFIVVWASWSTRKKKKPNVLLLKFLSNANVP